MRQPLEFSIELSAEELLAPPVLERFAGIEAVGCVDTRRAATLAPGTASVPAVSCDDDPVEIELTAAEMNALLSGEWP